MDAGPYVWLTANGLICWGLLRRSWDPERRDLSPLILIFGFLPAFVIFAGGVQLLLR